MKGYLLALIGLVGSGLTLTVYVTEVKPKHPPSAIVSMYEQQAGSPDDADPRDITAYLLRPQHAALRERIVSACNNGFDDSPASQERKVCGAAIEARMWANPAPAKRDGFSLPTWP